MSDAPVTLEEHDARGLKIAIVRSRFNSEVTSGLLAGARGYLIASGAEIIEVEVPGAFELPLLAQRLIDRGCDGVVALGAVIEGETDHYEHVAHRSSEGLMRVMLDTGRPIGFGMLAVRRVEDALARSRPGPGNKGTEAAAAVVAMALTLRRIRDQ